jgi:hypothetical protein
MPDNRPKSASGGAATEASSAKDPPNHDLLGEYVPTEELAKIFNVTPRTVNRWTRLKLLPAPLKLGRKPFHHIPSVRKRFAERMAANNQGRRKS